MEGQEQVSKLWEYYQNGRAYQQTLGITEQIPKNIDFYEGRQWPKETEATRNMPRPVVNLVKMIVRNKKAGILGSKVRLVFTAGQDAERSERITAFNRYIEKEMNMEELRDHFADDAIKKGNGFMHFFWDAQATGASGEYVGGVRGEIIDPLNIFFANPNETDEQKQQWILIASRVELDTVKKMAAKGVPLEDIRPDTADTRFYDENEQSGSELVTVLTRYFRKDGEVYFERGTKTVMLHAPISLTPTVKITAKENDVPAAKARLYPIVVYTYEPREKSIYGISEIEDIIPNQKSVNFNLGMQLLSVQNQAWGKYIVRSGALKDQKISNVPGQVLYDYSPEGNGIRKLTEQPFSQMPLQLVDSLTEATRMVTGSTEVMTGESVSANQSGAAIAQLQSQALKPIAELRSRYWRACEKGGKIVEQFYKLFYENKTYEEEKDDEILQETFNGAEYSDLDFRVHVEASAGTQYSDSLVISMLDQMLAQQIIDPQIYIELYPDGIMPFKATLKKKLEEREQSENRQLKQQLQQALQYVQGLSQQIKQQDAIVSQAASLVRQVDALKKQNEAVMVEGASKILAQNEALKESEQLRSETQEDAALLASLLAENQNRV